MGLRSLVLAAVSSAALLAGASAQQLRPIDENAPVLFQADRLVYDTDGRTVRLIGGVEISSDDRLLTADEVAYDQTTGVVTAFGNVTLREADGSIVTADRVELTGDLKDGFIQNIAIVLDEYTRLAAARATREGGTKATLDSAIFTPCRVCRESGQTEPLWQIKAVRVVWDQEAKRISYEDASFEFFGVTLAAVPRFSHADFTVKNQTGFLAPTAGHSSDLGYFIEVPYHFALDPSYDLTLAAMMTTDVNPVLKASFRQRTENGGYYLSGSLTYDDAFDAFDRTTGEGKVYGHIFGRGRFTITETMGWGFDIERTSSDTYLERYEISDTDRLTSRAYWTWRSGRSYASVSAYAFQGLRAEDDEGRTPLVLPEAQLHYVMPETVAGGELAFDGSFLALSRSEGLDTMRASAGASWNRPFVLDGGQAITLFAHARADLYHLSDAGFGADESDTLGRVTGYAGVDVRWPFVRVSDEGHTQIIEPIAQVIIAPYGSNARGIPNEDSLSLEFDDTNLFSHTKFTGLDLVESGPRANVGLRYAEFFPNGGSMEVLAGFQVRLDDDPAFLGSTGLGETQSDYVSRISVTPWQGLTITNRMRLDKDDFSVRRNEVYIQGTGSFYEIDASYLKLESDPALIGLQQREEVSLRSRVYVDDYWSLIGGYRRDLESDQTIEHRLAVAYEDECAFFELGFRRRFTRDRDADPSTTVILSVRLKALGDDGPAEPLFERDPYLSNETRDSRDFGGF